jgi:GH24 family phage-related lysozyme (muramidase)
MRSGRGLAWMGSVILVVILATAAPAATQDAPDGSATVEPPSGSAEVVSNSGYGSVLIKWNATCPLQPGENPKFHAWTVAMVVRHADGTSENSDSHAYSGVTSGQGQQKLVVRMARGLTAETFSVQVTLSCYPDPPRIIGNTSFKLCRGAVDLSDAGAKFIKQHEGCHRRVNGKVVGGQACLQPYSNDGSADGNCTIGWGHLVHTGKCRCTNPHASCRTASGDRRQQREVKAEKPFYKGISEGEAEHLFDEDERDNTELAKSLLKDPVNQCQLDALADFFFNLGGHAYRVKHSVRATIVASDLLDGNYDKIPADLDLYDRGNDSVHARHVADGKKFGHPCASC